MEITALLRFVVGLVLRGQGIKLNGLRNYAIAGKPFATKYVDPRIYSRLYNDLDNVDAQHAFANAFDLNAVERSDIDHQRFLMLKTSIACLTMTKSMLQSGLRVIDKNIGLLDSRDFSRVFADHPISTSHKADEELYVDSIRRYNREHKTKLPTNILFDINIDDQFNAARRRLTMDFVNATSNYLRQNGMQTLDVEQLKRVLRAKQITVFRIPLNFVGQIDDQGRLYVDNKLIDGVPPGYAVTMGSGSGYTFKSIGVGQQKQYYTVEYKVKANAAKFNKVEQFVKEIPVARTHWLKDLVSHDVRLKMLATIVEIGYKCQARIGSDTGFAGQKTYGISVLDVSHMRFIDPWHIVLQYIGKDGILQTHYIPGHNERTEPSDLLIIKNINEFIGTRTTGKVWSTNGVTINDKDINQYLQKLIPGSHFHFFRHAYAVTVQQQALDNNPFRDKDNTVEDVDAWYNKNVAERIGTKLGHFNRVSNKVTGKTARENYMSPVLSAKFYEDANVKIPLWLSQLMDDDWTA